MPTIDHRWAKIGPSLWLSLDAYRVGGVRRRFTPREARDMARSLGGQLPTAAELDRRWAAAGLHNVPHPLPYTTKGDAKHSALVDADIPDDYEWIVGNCGKHWVSDKLPSGARALYGWHYDWHTKHLKAAPIYPAATLDDAWVIQRVTDSSHNDAHSDYSMTGVFARDTEPDEYWEIGDDGYVRHVVREGSNDLNVAAKPEWLDPSLPPRMRQLLWMLHHEGHRETGPNTSALIDKWAEHATRDVDGDGDEDALGRDLWTERSGADWCAAMVGASIAETALPGDPSMPTPRVSMKEMLDDAKAAGTFVPIEDIVSGKVELLPGWKILWPRYDPGTRTIGWRGHVSTKTTKWVNRAAWIPETIDGNVGNAVTLVRNRPLIGGPGLDALGAVRIPDGPGGEPTRNSDDSQQGRLVEGIDVSVWQKPEHCDYPTLAKRFGWGIARTSYGVTRDRTFPVHINGMRSAGMKVGGFIFFIQDEPWSKQAEVFISQADAAGYGKRGDILPVVDLEVPVKGRGPLDPNAYNEAGRKLTAYLAERYGGAMIYTNLNTIALMGTPKWIDKYPLWLASQTTKPEPTGPSRWSIWQYDATRVDGYSGPAIDVNRARELPLIG